MTESSNSPFNRREFIQGALAGAAIAAIPIPSFAAGNADMQTVLSQIPKMHDENVKHLQEWIALPSIAAENRNYPQGPEYMAKLAREAGFTDVEIVPTSGKPGVFGVINAGAPTTVGIYFMYDVKQFDPAEWSSPPLEGKIVDKPGMGKVCVGRGAVNQKGPETAFLSALRAFKEAKVKLPVNLVLVCEGEEEIGSPHFPEIVKNPKVMAALQKIHRCFHAFGRSGSRRQRRDRSRRQRRGRVGAGFHRREMGTRSQARRPLQPGSHRGQPYVAPGAGPEHADPARRSHPRGAGLLRQSQAV